jgi:hypothetical protein
VIAPICFRCGDELGEFGGILLGPPDDKDRVVKRHLCAWCHDLIVKDVELERETFTTCLCSHVVADHDRMGCAERGCNCVSYTDRSTGKMRMGTG